MFQVYNYSDFEHDLPEIIQTCRLYNVFIVFC